MWYYFCFKPIISTNFNIIVDCTIGAPGNGNDVIDGINACDMRYFMSNMYDWYPRGKR